MSVTSDRNETVRLLRGLEDGTLKSQDAYQIASKRDPIMLYFVLRYLREKHPASSPQSTGVNQRLLELSGTYPDVVAMAKKGEKDAMREWFDDTYAMREFFSDSEKFVDLIIDKLEG